MCGMTLLITWPFKATTIPYRLVAQGQEDMDPNKELSAVYNASDLEDRTNAAEAYPQGYGDTARDVQDMHRLGKKQEFKVNHIAD